MEYDIASDESVSTAVVRAVSAARGREQCTLPPLSDVLDPDALNALFADRADGTGRAGGHLDFVYAACRVTVDNGEYLTLDPIGAAFDPDRVSG
ncbi:HalOD1 output domain-containing protein [Haloplanus salilacus]|uniref:HalOD1 output domain-containing protein n=1 Tax=Haloplanus salilacus TaxID=2949994 RepID=UPI0030CACDC2